MSAYDAVKTALAAGTPAELICAACPWDRLCIQPPSITTAEVDAKIAEAEKRDAVAGKGFSPAALLVAATLGGRDTSGQMCPVFTVRLRSDRAVADGVRGLMRGYAEPGASS